MNASSSHVVFLSSHVRIQSLNRKSIIKITKKTQNYIDRLLIIWTTSSS